jgi:immune inhibitor A
MCCWCLAELGWIRPTVVKRGRALTLAPLATARGDCYRLWTRGAAGPECFLIENRQAAGRDAALPGSGLALWHIDETQDDNTNPLSYRVGLVQADGRRDLEFNRNAGDDGDLFPGSRRVTGIDVSTNPSTRASDGSATRVALSAIKLANGAVTLKVKV